LFAGDAPRDLDGDGQSNVGEYLAATDPRNGLDVFRSTLTPGPVGAGFKIGFIARANHTYTIQFKNSLSDTAWQRLADIAAQASDHAEERTDAAAPATRFYRVITPQAP
jgi:hypothetical protein